MAAWLATIARDLKRGGYSAFRHFDTVIKLSQHCEQNRPCFSRMTDAELEAAGLEGWSGWLRFFDRLTNSTGLGNARVPGLVSFLEHPIG